jgi:peptidoglycan-N-acetylglucosamine deacetylase
MAGPATRTPRRPPDDSGRSREELRERRQRRQRELRRRRLTFVGIAGGVLVVLIVAIVALSGGGDDKGKQESSNAGQSNGSSSSSGKSKAQSAKAAPSTSSEYRRESRAISKVLGYTPFISRGSANKREVALTIDDGPGPLTPQFVSTLKRLNAPATFFVVGQQLNSFDRGLKDAVKAGFPIGDHTEQHQNLPTLSQSAQAKAIRDAALRIRSYGVPYPRLFRPPGGAFDDATVNVLKQHRMLAVLWSVDTGDYTRPGTGAIVQRAVQGAKPGAIILMHDGGGDRSQTLAALPGIIRGLRKRGFKLVTVPQLMLGDPPSRHQVRPGSKGD